MAEPTHAVVIDSKISDLILMTVQTAQLFRDQGFVEQMWGADAALIDVTDTDPRPDLGWVYDGTAFTAPPESEPASVPTAS